MASPRASTSGPQEVKLAIDPITFGPRTTVAVSDVSTSVVAANANRKGLLFSNDDTGKDCWIAVGGQDPVADVDFKVEKGATLLVDTSLPITGEIKAICRNAQTTNITFQEAV